MRLALKYLTNWLKPYSCYERCSTHFKNQIQNIERDFQKYGKHALKLQVDNDGFNIDKIVSEEIE